MARGVFSTSNYFLVSSGIITSTPLTIAGWVKTSSLVANQYIGGIFYTSAGSGTAIDGWTIRIHNTSGNVRAYVGDGATLSFAESASGLSTDAWAHVAAKFVSSTSRYAYLDGTPGAQSTTSRSPSATPDKTAIGAALNEVGGIGGATTPANSCHLAEFGFWNVALSDTEIAQLAAGYSPLFIQAANLHYYKLYTGDGSGDEPEDLGKSTMVEQGTVSTQTHPTIIYPKQWQTKLNQSVNRSNNF